MPSTLEEKDAIRELLAEYCFRLDDGHFAEMAALFAEGGSWDTAFGKATGRAAIADLARNLRERWPAAVPRDPSGDQHRDRTRWRERAGALKLDSRAEQSRRPEGRLGWRLP
jgi:hypothetical protein